MYIIKFIFSGNRKLEIRELNYSAMVNTLCSEQSKAIKYHYEIKEIKVIHKY
jgi:hypothetical protein